MHAIQEMGQSAWIKLDILSKGIEIDESVATFIQLKEGIALRKNFYNSPVWYNEGVDLPQELIVAGRVVGLNSYGRSPWRLRWVPPGGALLVEHVASGATYAAELVSDLQLLRSNNHTNSIANLYGGAALAFFSPRRCYFFSEGTACGFCSLAGTAAESRDFKGSVSEKEIEAVVESVLQTDPERIEQIMIVGGNMRDLNRGFVHHVSLGIAASKVLSKAGLSEVISVHIATMPPRDLDLISSLQEIENPHVMFNLEVWDQRIFATLCPGKENDYGRSNVLIALDRLRNVIGSYRAHSLLIAGLEPPESTVAGAKALAEMGVSPIVNIYHSDRHSRLGLGERPTFDQLAKVATGLERLYSEYPIIPYWKNCGRNSIDTEAQLGLFRESVPAFLTTADV